MVSAQSGSVHNSIPASGGSMPNALASPAGSVHEGLHAPLSSALVQPLKAQVIQKLSAHIRPSSAQRGPSQSKPPVTAPAVVMQHSPPSSRDGSMHQQRQLASAAAARGCSGENRHDEMPGRNTSLAVSVANTMNLQARPTSTQEGAETPIAASDDDTIEMHAQGAEGSRHGRSKRLRSSGAGRVGSGTPGASREVATDVHKATRSLPLAAQSPVDTAAAAPPGNTARKAWPASEAAVQPTACVSRRPATRALVQRAAMLAQDLKMRNGHTLEAAAKAAVSTAFESAFLAASPRRADACETSKPSTADKECPQGAPATDASVPQSIRPLASEGAIEPEQGQTLGPGGRTTGSNELQLPHEPQMALETGPSRFYDECRSQEEQQTAPQITHASNAIHSPQETAVNGNRAEKSPDATHAHEHSAEAGPTGDERPQPSTAARRYSRAKSEAVSVAAAVSASPAVAIAGTAHNHQQHVHHEGHGSMGVAAGGDPGACGSAVHQCAEIDAAADAGALRREADAEVGPAVPEAEPEPQPAACTVPLQPPQLTSPCDRGPRTSRRSPVQQASGRLPCTPGVRGEGGGAHSGDPRGHEDEAEYGEVQQGGAAQRAVQEGYGMELSVEQGRVVGEREEEEGDGEGRGVPIGRADAIIGDGIVGAATEDLEMKMSVEMGMEVNCGWAAGSAEQDGGQCEMQDNDVPGGGRADAVIMQARGDDGEEEVQAKAEGENGIASSCEDPGQGHAARDASCEDPGHGHGHGHAHRKEHPKPPQEESGGATMRAAAAAAISGTLGRVAVDKTWREPPGASPAQVSESGSGNAGQQDLCDNESEAFQGSAGAVHEVADRAHSSGVPGLERREGVGEVTGHRMHAGNSTHIPREEGEGEVGAASREASRGQDDSVRTPSGYHADSLQFQHAQGVAGGNATSRAATGGTPPMPFVTDVAMHATRDSVGTPPAWWERGAGDVSAVQQGEGEGEIAGPAFRDSGAPNTAPNDALAAAEGAQSAGDWARLQEEHLSRAGDASQHQHQRNMHDTGAMNDVADSGQQRNQQQENVVESTLHVPADSLQPTGSRTGEALPQIASKLATRAVSGAGANFSAAEDPERDARGDPMQNDTLAQPPFATIAHQTSVNLTVCPRGSSGARHRGPVPAGLNVEPRGQQHTLSRVGSVDNVPLEAVALAAAAAAGQRQGEGVPPLLLAGVSEHAAPQLGARTSGTGCAVTAAMAVDPTGSTALHTTRQISQSIASHPSPSPTSSAQQPAAATAPVAPNSVTPNTLFPFLPLTSQTSPQLNRPTAASHPFLFTSPLAPTACNAPPPSLLPVDPYAILSSLLPQHGMPTAAQLPHTAAACTSAPASFGAAPAATATAPPQHPNVPLATVAVNLQNRVSTLGPPRGKHTRPLAEPNGMHAPHARSSVSGVSLSSGRSAPVDTLAHAQPIPGMTPMPLSLPNGIRAGAATNAVAYNATELPQLLHHLPGHLQAWLQELCKEDARAGQLLQALQVASAAQRVVTTSSLHAAAHHSSAAAHSFPASSHFARLPAEPATAPLAAVYPASLLHAMHLNTSNLASPGPLTSQLLTAVPPALRQSSPVSAGGAAGGANAGQHGAAPSSSPHVTWAAAGAGLSGGLNAIAPLATQPLTTLLNVLGSSASRGVLTALLPSSHSTGSAAAPPGAAAVATGAPAEPPASALLNVQPSWGGKGAGGAAAYAAAASTPLGGFGGHKEPGEPHAKRGQGRGGMKRQRGGPVHTDSPLTSPVAAPHISSPDEAQAPPANTAAKRQRTSARNSPVLRDGAAGVPASTGGPVATRASTSAAAAAIALSQKTPAAHNLTALIGSGNAAAVPPHAPAFSSPRTSPGRGYTHSAAHRAARHAARNASAIKPGVGAGSPRSAPAAQYTTQTPEVPVVPDHLKAVTTAAGSTDNALTDAMAALLDLRSTGADEVPAADDVGNEGPEGDCAGTALTHTQRAVLEKRLGAVFESLKMDPVALQQALQVALFNSDASQ